MDEPKKKGRPKGLTERMQAEIRAELLQRRIDGGMQTGPGDKRLRPVRQEEVRAHIQTTKIVQRLQQCGEGLIELTPVQVQAYKILLDKSLASLQATEITEVSKNDKLSEAEILAKIADIVKREPRLADMVQLRNVVDVAPMASEGDDPSAAPAGDDAYVGDDTCDTCGGAVQWGVCASCGAMVGA